MPNRNDLNELEQFDFDKAVKDINAAIEKQKRTAYTPPVVVKCVLYPGNSRTTRQTSKVIDAIKGYYRPDWGVQAVDNGLTWSVTLTSHSLVTEYYSISPGAQGVYRLCLTANQYIEQCQAHIDGGRLLIIKAKGIVVEMPPYSGLMPEEFDGYVKAVEDPHAPPREPSP